jgi:hypothetical protein
MGTQVFCSPVPRGWQNAAIGRPATLRRRFFTKVLVVALVSGSANMFGCGGDIPKSAMPAPEYERPVVSVWPPADNVSNKEAPQPQAVRPVEDAGDGSEYLDANQAQ